MNTAHRGASAYAPENTFAAFDLALTLGATAFELDVQESSDGELVVAHDVDLARIIVGNTSVRVGDLTWGQLSCLDAGTWFNAAHPRLARPEYSSARLVRLEDVFERYGDDVSYLIEIKRPISRRTAPTVAGLVGSRLSTTQTEVVVASFDQKCLQTLQELDSSIKLVQLFGSYATSSAIRTYLAAVPSYCSGIGPGKDAIDAHLIAAARAQGLGVFAWTVNERHELADMIDLRVEGIVTDFPDLLDDLLVHRHRSPQPPRAVSSS